MRIDPSLSRYREDSTATTEFDTSELRRARYLLRRLQYLEHQVRERGGMASGDNGGGVHAEWEIEALEWVLDQIGYLAEPVSGNAAVTKSQTQTERKSS